MAGRIKAFFTRRRVVAELISFTFGTVFSTVLGVVTGLSLAVLIPFGIALSLLLAAIAIAYQDRDDSSAGQLGSLEFVAQSDILEPARAVELNGRRYEVLTRLWIRVTNNGKGGLFLARAKRVTGVPWPDYEVDPLAWEHTDEPRERIEAGGSARVLLATVAARPFGFWFTIPKSASYGNSGHLAGNQAVEPLVRPVYFDFEVVNCETNEVWSRQAVLTANGRDRPHLEFSAAAVVSPPAHVRPEPSGVFDARKDFLAARDALETVRRDGESIDGGVRAEADWQLATLYLVDTVLGGPVKERLRNGLGLPDLPDTEFANRLLTVWGKLATAAGYHYDGTSRFPPEPDRPDFIYPACDAEATHAAVETYENKAAAWRAHSVSRSSRLQIEAGNGLPFDDLTEFDATDQYGLPKKLRVTNIGGQVARNCRARSSTEPDDLQWDVPGVARRTIDLAPHEARFLILHPAYLAEQITVHVWADGLPEPAVGRYSLILRPGQSPLIQDQSQ